MAEELGLQGLAVPEEYGGTGYGVAELQIVLEELGRSLVCAPFLSSAVLASTLILASGDTAACQDYLPELCSGALIATAAVTEDGAGWDADTWQCVAVAKRRPIPAERTEVVRRGRADRGPPARGRRQRVGAWRSSRSTPAPPGSSVGAMENLDATRRLGWVHLEAAEGRLLGSPGAAAGIVQRALVPTAAALAAEQVGGARRALELAVEYAKVRKQFGRLIGSFQAIKQKCADVLMAVEAASSAAYAAGLAIDEGSDESAALAYLALAQCSEAYQLAATENIEIHGGIGFTWEHSAHLYYKRAIASSVLFGTAASHRERMLIELGR